MSLNRDQINSIAHLARLSLTETEIPVYQDSLSKIVDLVGQLDAAPTQGVEPMAHPLPGLARRMRSDVVSGNDQHVLYQRNAPHVEAALYLVRKVIEIVVLASMHTF